MTTTTFQVGATYSTRFICDHDSILSITIAKRSKCFLTTTERKRVKVYEDNGVEYCYPTGIYSMAPIVRADKPAEVADPFSSEMRSVKPYFVTAKFADLNKNDNIGDYVEQIKNKKFDINRVRVCYEVKLSLTQWNEFCTALLDSHAAFDGKGGNSSDFQLPDGIDFLNIFNHPELLKKWQSQSYIDNAILVSCGWQSVIVDPQGYDYARYVGLDVQRERHLKAVA